MKPPKNYSESEYNRLLSVTLRAAGAKVISLVGAQMQEPGLPDRYCSHKIFTGWLEGKLRGGNLRTDQAMLHESFIVRGTPCLVLRYWPEHASVTIDWCYARGKQQALSCFPLKLVTGESQEDGLSALAILKSSWEKRDSIRKNSLSTWQQTT